MASDQKNKRKNKKNKTKIYQKGGLKGGLEGDTTQQSPSLPQPPSQPTSCNQLNSDTLESLTFLVVLRFLACSFKNSNIVSMITISITVLCIIATMILSIVYLALLVTDNNYSKRISNPINRESANYQIIKSIDITKTKYKYQLFIILPVISIIFAILTIFSSSITSGINKAFKYNLNTDLQPGIRYIAIGSFIYALFSFIFNISYYRGVYGILVKKYNKINDNINNYINQNIYKTNSFLEPLQQMPTNSLATCDIVSQAINGIPTNTNDVKSISQIFFTINLYYYYLSLGYNNSNTPDALNQIFNIKNLFTNSLNSNKFLFYNIPTWSPADFLFNKYTFMEDRTSDIKQIYNRINPSAKQNTINTAIAQVKQTIANFNNNGNSIYAEDAWNSFLGMAIAILVIQSLPLLIVLITYHYYKRKIYKNT